MNLETALIEFMGSFSVLSLVPSQIWSTSNLKVSRTFPPDLFSMPDNGNGGKLSLVFYLIFNC